MLKNVGNRLFAVVLRSRRVSSTKQAAYIHADRFVTKSPNNTMGFRSPSQIRGFFNTPSSSSSSIINVDYGRMKEFVIQNDALIIDVRTKDELIATGVIPNSCNIPLDELNAAFELTPNEFLNKYNFPKPNKEQTVVFSCAKGVRSLKAASYITSLGYKNVYNYTEGWLGWEAKNK